MAHRSLFEETSSWLDFILQKDFSKHSLVMKFLFAKRCLENEIERLVITAGWIAAGC